MALRWRKDGRLLCAKYNSRAQGDTYIDDRLHYYLSEIIKTIRPIGDGKKWTWIKKVPK
jgi:hypothetical protein